MGVPKCVLLAWRFSYSTQVNIFEFTSYGVIEFRLNSVLSALSCVNGSSIHGDLLSGQPGRALLPMDGDSDTYVRKLDSVRVQLLQSEY